MPGVLTQLRDLTPLRPLTVAEGLRIAELQAARMLELAGIEDPPVPESLIADLPRFRVERTSPLPLSGATHWAGGYWYILLNRSEPEVRTRFSLAHEFKHALDNFAIRYLYPEWRGLSTQVRAEQVCDHFAACLLMPRACVKRLWGKGVQDPAKLAARFQVSRAAMQIRLTTLGLAMPRTRCDRAPVAA